MVSLNQDPCSLCSGQNSKVCPGLYRFVIRLREPIRWRKNKTAETYRRGGAARSSDGVDVMVVGEHADVVTTTLLELFACGFIQTKPLRKTYQFRVVGNAQRFQRLDEKCMPRTEPLRQSPLQRTSRSVQLLIEFDSKFNCILWADREGLRLQDRKQLVAVLKHSAKVSDLLKIFEHSLPIPSRRSQSFERCGD